jgi:transcriptional regulator with XRE-family HTH domain
MEREFGTGARMRAARHLAGYSRVEDLAEAINQEGLRTTVLREIEREQRRGEFRELREIAECCGLPVEFFTADFSRLGEISEDPRRVIAARLAAARERSRQRRGSKPEDPPSLGLADRES